MTLRMCVIVAAILVFALAGVSGCTGDSGSGTELAAAITAEPTAAPARRVDGEAHPGADRSPDRRADGGADPGANRGAHP